MTTNRMGLEQTLSDEQVKELGETLRSWQDGYDPIDDKEQYQLFANTMTALNELLARRDASKKAVAWTDAEELRDLERDGYAAMLSINNQDKNTDPRRQIMLYAAPQLPAVTVPDEMLSAFEEVLRISDRNHDVWDAAKLAISKYRAAALNHSGDATDKAGGNG